MRSGGFVGVVSCWRMRVRRAAGLRAAHPCGEAPERAGERSGIGGSRCHLGASVGSLSQQSQRGSRGPASGWYPARESLRGRGRFPPGLTRFESPRSTRERRLPPVSFAFRSRRREEDRWIRLSPCPWRWSGCSSGPFSGCWGAPGSAAIVSPRWNSVLASVISRPNTA